MNVALAAAFLIPRKKRNAMLVAGLAAAAVLQAGRLIEAPVPKADRAALLVQQNIPVTVDWTPLNLQQTLEQLTDLTLKSAASNSGNKIDLVVWPESPAPFFTNDPRFRNGMSDLARLTNTWIIAGSIGSDGATPNSDSPLFNSAVLVSPGGEWTSRSAASRALREFMEFHSRSHW